MFGELGLGVGSPIDSIPLKYSRCVFIEYAMRAIQLLLIRLVADSSKPLNFCE